MSVELWAWKLYSFVTQYHPNKFSKKEFKKEKGFNKAYIGILQILLIETRSIEGYQLSIMCLTLF